MYTANVVLSMILTSRKLKNFIIKPLVAYKLLRSKHRLNRRKTVLALLLLLLPAFVYFGLRRIDALEESTHSIAAGGDTDIASGTMLDTQISGSEVILGQAADWFDSDWLYKKQLNLTNVSGSTVAGSATTFTQISVNTKELVAAGKLQNDCDDLRVVYYTGSGSPTELPRNYTVASGASNCSDSTSTLLRFPIQASIGSAATDGNYWLYYGNSGASAPVVSGGASQNTILECVFNGSTSCYEGVTASTASGPLRFSGTKSALDLDGFDDYITVADSSSLGFDMSSFTIEFWMYARTLSYGGAVMNQRTNDLNQIRILFDPASNGSTDLGFRIGDTSNNYVNLNLPYSSYKNQWVHLVWTIDRDTDVSNIYVNGFLSTSASIASITGNINPTGNLTIGSGSGRYLDGMLDQIHMYTGVASPAEITAHYNSGQGVYVEKSSASRLYLNFDETGKDPRNSTRAFDASGNENHGTLVNGAQYASGLLGIDASSAFTGAVPSQSFAAHRGVVMEKSSTNLVQNPSFEASTFDTGWTKAADIETSLVAHWKLDEASGNRADAVGSNTLADVNTVTQASGKVGNAAKFTAANTEYLSIADNAQVSTGSTDFTLTAWVYLDSKSATRTIISKFGSGTTDREYVLSYSSTADRFMFQLFGAASSTHVYADALGSPSTGTWYFIVAWQDTAGDTVNIQVNNGTVNSGAWSSVTNDSTTELRIGDLAYTSAPFDGRIDEVGFWKRILTGTERTALYNSGSGTTTPYASVTKNTAAEHIRYGSSSTLITAVDQTNLTTSITVGATNYVLSAYVKNNSTGAVRGSVDATVAKLIFNGTAQTTTYTDVGGGWWRLTYAGTGVAPTQSYGIQLLAGKSIYLDALQLENEVYATSYLDGSLGSGYSWSGTAHASQSTRSWDHLGYSLSPTSFTWSGWVYFLHGWDARGGNARTIFATLNGSSEVNSLSVRNDTKTVQLANGSGTTNITTHTFSGLGWHYVALTNHSGSQKLYLDGSLASTVSTSMYSITAFHIGSRSNNASAGDGVFADVRIYDTELTAAEIADIYRAGLLTHSKGSEAADRFADSGSWTSPSIDLTNAGAWGEEPNLLTTENLNGNQLTYQTRTSPDGSSWSEFQDVTGASGSYGIASPPDRYIQVRANFSSVPTSGLSTPSFSAINFNYVEDAVPPVTNASNILAYTSNGGDPIVENDWIRTLEPYFSWTEGHDDVGGSGIRGYCLYLGTDPAGDPALSKGLLGSSPGSLTSTTCQFIVESTFVDFANLSYRGSTWLTSSSTPYYLNIKAVDQSGNIFADSSEQFYFRFDTTSPDNPQALSAPQGYQREITSFTIYWPVTGNAAATDAHSGIKGYQYRIGADGVWQGSGHTGEQDCNDLITTGAYTLDPEFDELGVGENIFYLRTWDNSCNVSTTNNTAILRYSSDAPSAPQNVQVSPTSNSVNLFSFTWDAPTTFFGNVDNIQYCYVVNNLPSSNICSWQSARSLAADAYASQPGLNTLYVVAKDEAGSVNYSDYASVTFTANTTAPSLPINVDIADVSIKADADWRLAVNWGAPEDVGAGVASYKVYRAVGVQSCTSNFSEFDQVNQVQGTSYIDTDIIQEEYSYCVKACDSANNCSAPSVTVSDLPTGKFKEPAELTSNPEVLSVSTRKATIQWSTDRASDSKIQYGLSSEEYFVEEVSNSTQKSAHSITLTNLRAGTVYYFRAKWTDEDGNTGISDEITFQTAPSPALKESVVRNIGIEHATLSFTTTGSSKAKVYYGTSLSFTSLEEINTSEEESNYSIILDGLVENQKYFIKINLIDSEGEEYEGDITSFTTLPKPRITNITIDEVEGSAQATILVEWDSNTSVSSIVTFHPSEHPDRKQDRIDLELIDGRHSLTIAGFEPDTAYVLQIRGVDRFGNEGISDEINFTTATDTRPPMVKNLKVEGTILSQKNSENDQGIAQLIVSWETDEPATSQVEFGEGTQATYVQSTQRDTDLKYNHVVVISNLTPSKVYHLRVLSTDVAGNSGNSEGVVTITPDATRSVVEVVLGSLLDIFGFLRR